MKRFVWGLVGGGVSAGVTQLIWHHTMLSLIVGGAVALVIWTGAYADAIGDAIDEVVQAILR